MLIRFRVENFRSLRDEQELSLVASSLTEHPDCVVVLEAPGISLLRVAAIYGANASGKTSVFSALKYMRTAVLESQRNWNPDGGVPRDPFLLDPEGQASPSVFSVDFLLEDVRYEYGFVVDSDRVLEEWLYAYPRGRRQEWFTREAGRPEEFKFSRLLPGENRSISSLTRPNSLYLSAAAQNNHEALTPVYKWFSAAFKFVDEDNREHLWRYSADLLGDPAYREPMLRLIQMSDLGITDIDVTEEGLPEGTVRVLQALFADRPKLLEEFMEDPTLPRVMLRHRNAADGGEVPLPFSEESRGTKALFSLSGAIVSTLSNGGLLCIDELDSSLHPLLAVEIVRLFNGSTTNPLNAQLIFNTHDTNLLDTSILRRDQIWFTEKDEAGATHLYPLTEFRARKQENLQRGYLQGRYGAVPFIECLQIHGGVAEQ